MQAGMWHPGLISNMNFPAPLSVAGFLAACAGLALCTLAIVVACFVGRGKYARLPLRLLGAGAMVYFGLLFACSLLSRDRLLALGEEKYFCEIDCHLAYSIVNVGMKPSGSASFFTVTLRTRFDEATISAHRPKVAPLTPNPRSVEVIDGRGQAYPVLAISGTPLSTPLRPGESYLTELRFKMPSGGGSPRLLLTSAGWPERLLIGDERSPLHGKAWFAL